MNPLILVGFLAFFVVALTVGIRLLALYWRTRELPELLIGIGVLGIGPLGFGGMMAGTKIENPAISHGLIVFGIVAVLCGVVAKCVFNWRVYRPESKVAMATSLSIALFLVAALAYRASTGILMPSSQLSNLGLAESMARVVALLWGSAEALRYWLLMRRRVRIGLADPALANRFLMWSLGAGAAGLGSFIGIMAQWISGLSTVETPWVIANSSAFGFLAAVAIFLAFVPPARYVEFLRRRSGALEA